MGLRSRWRAGRMKDPVSGVFKVADWYDTHPHGSPSGTTLTGVLVADGVAPTPAEAPADHHGTWVGRQELPVTVDRADPSIFRIEWDHVARDDPREAARHRAAEVAATLAAAKLSAGQVGHTVAATGVVTAVYDVVPQMPLPAGMSQTDLTLDVSRTDGSTYAVTTRMGFRSPERRTAIAAIGTRLPVLVDPTNPGRVTIDVAKLDLP
ncbi:MAG TPA: hypothetical protein VHF06_20270 [Pseudonocardiaceae bacterium]|nr:hypothetical protein [Pseudonocardiaceae bacterium]